MNIAIYGPGGFGREIISVANDTILAGAAVGADSEGLLFISDSPAEIGRTFEGVPCVALSDVPDDYLVVIAVGDAAIRRRLSGKVSDAGLKFASIAASNLYRGPGVVVGEGAVLCPFVTLTASCKIGRHFHANLYSYIAHDCVIGDFVTLAPKACVNGNVTVGDGAYIGTGAMIRQGVSIGAGAVVGMGAVVTKDVPPGVTVMGNPARAREA